MGGDRLGADLRRPGREGGGALPQCHSWAAVAARPGGTEARGVKTAPTSGPGRQRQGTGGRGRLPGAAAGPSGRGARLGQRLPGKKLAGRKQGKEEMIIFPFYFPNKFSQKHFQIIFLNSFEI